MRDLYITLGWAVLCVAGVLVWLYWLDRRDAKRYWPPTKTDYRHNYKREDKPFVKRVL